MSDFYRILGETLFRLKLYLFGIRFYERPQLAEVAPIHEAEYRLDHEKRIHFKFYRVLCNDTILKRGRLVSDSYASYVVQAFLNDQFSPELRAFNGKNFFFNGVTNDFFRSEKRTVELILDVYLDFLKSSVEMSEK